VTTQNRAYLKQYIEIAQSLRAAGVNTELYLAEKPLGVQMKFAGKKGYRFAIIADQSELDAHQVIVRDMKSGEQKQMDLERVLDCLSDLRGRS
jgi:histidyl-tRNA synthetase